MAHAMRAREGDADVVALGGSAANRRGRAALYRLMDAAGRDHQSSWFVLLLLETAADMAERRTAPGVVPTDERLLWESVGASFDAPETVARSHAQAVGAFASLLDRSVKGDAGVAELLHVDRSRISQRVSERSLFAVAGPDDRYFPQWQFDRGRVLRGLRAVLGVLDAGLHPLTVDRWFTAPNGELVVDGTPVTPVSWLSTGGEIDTVSELARDL